MDQSLINALGKYASVLWAFYSNCHDANERTVYEKHFPFFTAFLAALHEQNDTNKLMQLVEGEARHHGWSFLSGEAGDNTAKAWQDFYKFFKAAP